MTNARRDENRVTTLMGVSDVDLDTPINVAVDHTTNELLVKDGSLTDGSQVTKIKNTLVTEPYDTIIINYTDSTKVTVSTYVFKLGAATVATITPTSASTSDTYIKT